MAQQKLISMWALSRALMASWKELRHSGSLFSPRSCLHYAWCFCHDHYHPVSFRKESSLWMLFLEPSTPGRSPHLFDHCQHLHFIWCIDIWIYGCMDVKYCDPSKMLRQVRDFVLNTTFTDGVTALVSFHIIPESRIPWLIFYQKQTIVTFKQTNKQTDTTNQRRDLSLLHIFKCSCVSSTSPAFSTLMRKRLWGLLREPPMQ